MAEKQWPQKHFLTFIHAVLFGNCCGPLIWKLGLLKESKSILEVLFEA